MRRIVSLFLGLALAAGVVSATAGAAAAKTKKGVLDDPCTLLDAAKVEKVFGGPVAEPVLDTTFISCAYAVGEDPTQEPGGTVNVVQLFPHFGQALPNATDAFQDQHAIDVLSEYELADINGLGRDAYMNLTTGTLVVLANKKVEISVSWEPGSVKTSVTKADQKKLVKLAKQAVARAPG
jgi:hypothetical protein